MNQRFRTEKILKRFLKNKISYSISVLISFLIMGQISTAVESQIISQSQSDNRRNVLLKKVDRQRERIKKEIVKREKRIELMQTKFVPLIEEGDYYAKPFYKTYQVFFNFKILNASKLKDRTRIEYAQTLKDMKKSGMYTFDKLTAATLFNIHEDTGGNDTKSSSILRKNQGDAIMNLKENNGLAISNIRTGVEIELGANIEKLTPSIPNINRTISVIPSSPNVEVPTPNLQEVQPPPSYNPINLPNITPPSIATVSVTPPVKPNDILPIGINVATPIVPNITPSISIPGIPTVAHVHFNPKVVTPPTPPTAPSVSAIQVTIPSVSTNSSGNVDVCWFCQLNGENSVISQIIIHKGKMEVKVAGINEKDGYEYKMTGFAGRFPNKYGGTKSTVSDIVASLTQPSGQMGVYRVVGANYTEFGKDSVVEIDARGRTFNNNDSNTLRQFIHFDPHGDKASSLEEAKEDAKKVPVYGSDKTVASYNNTGDVSHIDRIQNEINLYHTKNVKFSNFGTAAAPQQKNLLLALRGKITVTGNNINVVGLQGHELSGGGTNPIIFHDGTLKINGNGNVIFAYVQEGDYSQTKNRQYMTFNEGNIEVKGMKNYVMVFDRVLGAHHRHMLNFKNNGNITLEGESNVGVLINKNPKKGVVDLQKPITIKGSNSKRNIAMAQIYNNSGISAIEDISIVNNEISKMSVIKADIENGEKNVGYYTEVYQNIEGQKGTAFAFNIKDGKENVGIYVNVNTSNLYQQSNYAGVMTTLNKLTLGKGVINITGGKGNIGIYTQSGDIKTDGVITITGGTNHIGVFSPNGGGNIDISELKATNNRDGVMGIVTQSKVVTVGKVDLNLGENGLGFFAKGSGAQIILTGAIGTINTVGQDSVAMFADSGGKIVAKNTEVKVIDGSGGIVSIGSTSSIDLSNGKIEYKGKGYAAYSGDKGKIDLTGTKIILDGSATAFDIDFDYAPSSSSSPVTLGGTTIHVKSNDVIAVNLVGTPVLTSTNLNNEITDDRGYTITHDPNADRYTIAAITGGEFTVNNNFTYGAGSNEDMYYKRLALQAMKITVNSAKTVTANISTVDANKYLNGQVIGLQNSNTKDKGGVSGITNTFIKLNGGHIVANRTDSGQGAVGAYINFGQIHTATGSTIKVEETKKNAQAVGIYAVNRSEVINAGEIHAYGNKSIGILGLMYREEGGATKINEYGHSRNKFEIENSGKIISHQAGGIAIYADNNSTIPKANFKVENTGTISVGDALGTDNSVGIYGNKVTITDAGEITTKDGGIGVFAKESAIQNIKEVKLGNKGVGVVLIGKSTFTSTDVFKLGDNPASNNAEKVAIMVKDNDITNVNVELDLTAASKATGLYVDNNKAVEKNKKTTVGDQGIGMYLVNGTLTNSGAIDFKPTAIKAIGMYVNKGTLINNAQITTNNSEQIGIYATGADANAENHNKISLTKNKSTGIFLTNNAKFKEIGTGKIEFGSSVTESIGIFTNNAEVTLTKTDFTSANENKNVYLFAKNQSKAVQIGELKVTGTGSSATGRTIGAYFEGNTLAKVNPISTGTAKLDVKGEAIGIYSKDVIEFGNIEVKADEANTTAIYLSKNSEFKGTSEIKAENSGIGVYSSGGKVKFTNGTKVNVVNSGTAVYLTDGGSVDSTAAFTATAGTNGGNVLVYSKGTNTSEVLNKASIILNSEKLTGILVTDGVKLKNSGVTTLNAKDQVGAYITGASSYESNGNISFNSEKGAGIYVDNGVATNNATVTFGNLSDSSIAMAAKSNKATIKNNIDITIDTDNSASSKPHNMGMYLEGGAKGENTAGKTINVLQNSIGLHSEGNNNFINAGTISISKNSIGISLKDRTAGTLNLGNIKLNNATAVGIFSNNSKIDFEIKVVGNNGISLYAGKDTKVSGATINTTDNGIGLYVGHPDVKMDGATVNAGSGSNSAGIYISDNSNYAATNQIDIKNFIINAKNGVGLFVKQNTKTIEVILDKTVVSTQGGTGIYVKDSKIIGKELTLNVKGGVGVSSDNSVIDLGNSGKLTVNFSGASSSIGIFTSNGGTLNLGSDVVVTGDGTLLSTVNSDLINASNITVKNGAIAISGFYDLTSSKTITNKTGATITAETGGIGIAAISNSTSITPGSLSTIINDGIIKAIGKSTAGKASIGIYSTAANVNNQNGIEAGPDAVGIYAMNKYNQIAVNNNNMKLNGNSAIGIFAKNAVVNSTKILGTGAQKAVGIRLEDGSIGNNLGNIELGAGSIGVIFENNSSATALDTKIKVGDSITGTTKSSSIGLFINKNSNVSLAPNTTISVGKEAVGIVLKAGSTVTIPDIAKITVKENSIFVHNEGGNLTFNGDLVVDGGTGISSIGGTVNTSGSKITVKNGGIGLYIKNSVPTLNNVTVDLQAGNTTKPSIGNYFENIGTAFNIPVVTQTGNNNIGSVLDKSIGTATTVTIGASGENQFAIYAKNNSKLTINGNIVVNGSSNTGVLVDSSELTSSKNITVGASALDPNRAKSSVGVYLKNIIKDYNGSGDIIVGNNSIGIYGENIKSNVKYSGTDMKVGNSGLGIILKGISGTGTKTLTTNYSKYDVGNNTSFGIYGENINIATSGDMNVANGSSIGLISIGKGNVTYTGNMVIADKGTSKASIGLYKKNEGNNVLNINNTSISNKFTVGDNGYGIYITTNKPGDTISKLTVNNKTNMILGESSVGIYSQGQNIISNEGNIIVGKTNLGPNNDHMLIDEHMNSIGIYIEDGTVFTNRGNITSHNPHSYSVYAKGDGTKFINEVGGVIDIDNGGVGIYVKEKAEGINKGIINLGNNVPSYDENGTVGMAAFGGGTIINDNTGTINVGTGIGMYVATASKLINRGEILISKGGIGISGKGAVVNTGKISVVPGGTGTIKSINMGDIQLGAVILKSDGTVIVNGNYISKGGVIEATTVEINGAYVSAVNNIPIIEAKKVSGEVKLLPDFAGVVDQTKYTIKNFINIMGEIQGSSKSLTIIPSPLFMPIMVGGDLVIVKKPYTDLVLGNQFKPLYDSLENIFQGKKTNDKKMIMEMNEHLETIYHQNKDLSKFTKEAGQTLAQTRGDMFTTSHKRVQQIGDSFSESFDRLENSYNTSKDASKYSIIFSHGRYLNATPGIDDYHYNTMGLLYVKEKEAIDFKHKYGISLGFGITNFHFKDRAGSLERGHTLRAGIHNSMHLSEKNRVSLLTNLNLTGTYHSTDRKIKTIGTKIYSNKGGYGSIAVSLDNKLNKNMYKSLETTVDLYGNLHLEYARVTGTKENEKGTGLKLDVMGSNHFSVKPEVGLKLETKKHLGNDNVVRLTGEVKYAHELANNSPKRETKLQLGNQKKNTTLINPGKDGGELIGKIGIKLEKAEDKGITLEGTATKNFNRENTDFKIGIVFEKKF